MIINKIGTLNDIPYKLANTVANIYYKLCLLLKINRSLGWWPRYDKHYEDKDPTKNMIKFIVSYNKLKADIISIP